MMRFHLRTLLILLAVLPPLLAVGWWTVKTLPGTAGVVIAIGAAAVFPLMLRKARAAISRGRQP
jgi:hypothetical protein